MAKWDVTVNEQTIDVGELSKQNYIGRTPAAALPAALKGSDEWASWVFSLSEVWQDDAPMQDRPLEVHCSGLGGGLLSGEHDYDIFLQNHAQTKVYGPSLAMTDNWEAHVTQLGLTKTVHEYASTSYSPLQKDGQLNETSSLNISPITNCCSRERFVLLRPRISGQPMPDHHTRMVNSNHADLSLLPSAR